MTIKKRPPPPKSNIYIPSPPPYMPNNIPTKQSMGSSIGRSVMEGMALGTGSAIGRNIVDKIMKPNVKPFEPQELKLDWCTLLKKSYDRCLKENPDVDTCENMQKMILNNRCE